LHFTKSSLRENWNQLEQERDALIHDIERSQDRNTALLAENNALRALLAEAIHLRQVSLYSLGQPHKLDEVLQRWEAALREGK
jgi:regulator of replication initiation timing